MVKRESTAFESHFSGDRDQAEAPAIETEKAPSADQRLGLLKQVWRRWLRFAEVVGTGKFEP